MTAKIDGPHLRGADADSERLPSASFERRLIQERTNAGLAVARARGRRGGRPPLDAEQANVLAAKKLRADEPITITDICRTLSISRSTYYRYLSLEADNLQEPSD